MAPVILRLFFIIFASLLGSCVYHDTEEVMNCDLSDLSIKLDSVSLATSCSIADGEIYVSASGGAAPYTFSINNQSPQLSNSFTELLPGTYKITVTDANACTVSINNINVLAKDLEFSTIIVDNSECANANGSITINVVSNDEEDFSYSLNDGAFSGSNVFTALKHGNYKVSIRKGISCIIELNITISRANTNTSWSTDILPIIETSCAVSGCHNGTSRLDYRIYGNAKKNAQQIKSLTQDGSMPFDGTPLTKSQIDLIACWVDDGAIDN